MSERFLATLSLPADVPIALLPTLTFAIRYSTPCGEWWDNNCGANYELRVLDRELEMNADLTPSSPIKKKTILLPRYR